MQNIICISGFSGAGKSTTSQSVFNNLQPAAYIEADSLFAINPYDEKSKEGLNVIGRIKLQNSLKVLQTYLEEDYQYIIIDGLVWSQSELDAVVNLGSQFTAKTFLFWLDVPTSARHSRAKKRNRDEFDQSDVLTERDKTVPDPRPFNEATNLTVKEISSEKTVAEITKEISSSL